MKTLRNLRAAYWRVRTGLKYSKHNDHLCWGCLWLEIYYAWWWFKRWQGWAKW